MKEAFRSVRSAIIDLWDHVILAALCSLVWLGLVLLIVPGPPATVALFDMADRIARREHLLTVGDYLRAVWAHFGVGWRWGALNALVLAVIVIDILMVPRMVSDSLALSAQMFFFLALVLWLVVNWFALAFLFRQKEPSLRQALRNGAVLLLQQPLFTLTVTAITAVLLGLSAVLVLLIIVVLLVGPMLVALISTRAVLNQVRSTRYTDNHE